MLTGCVRLDLSTVDPDKMAKRLSVLGTVPDGAAVSVYVGPRAPEPGAIRALRGCMVRLHVTIEGEPHSVPAWLSAIRDGLAGELVVLP